MRFILGIFVMILITACGSVGSKSSPQQTATDSLEVNMEGKGQYIEISVERGSSFYYPLMAIWIEDKNGNYVQTVYVAKSVATSVFKFGAPRGGKWQSAVKRYPQTLPYWAHRRGEKASDGLYMPEPGKPVADAYTGATPVSSFNIYGRLDDSVSLPFKVMMEINQNWDFNKFWTNDKYPDDEFYKLSCQPAVVYEATITSASDSSVSFRPIGHSHWSGQNGNLYEDLSTLTTALKIVGRSGVRVSDQPRPIE